MSTIYAAQPDNAPLPGASCARKELSTPGKFVCFQCCQRDPWLDNAVPVQALDEYNETNAVMDLVLFEDAMKHVCRISRIISSSR